MQLRSHRILFMQSCGVQMLYTQNDVLIHMTLIMSEEEVEANKMKIEEMAVILTRILEMIDQIILMMAMIYSTVMMKEMTMIFYAISMGVTMMSWSMKTLMILQLLEMHIIKITMKMLLMTVLFPQLMQANLALKSTTNALKEVYMCMDTCF